MPYIKKERRKKIEDEFSFTLDYVHDKIHHYVIQNMIDHYMNLRNNYITRGDLNYIFYLTSLFYINRDMSYDNISHVINTLKFLSNKKFNQHSIVQSALTDCQDELRRRVLHPYEDLKIEENGDITI